MNHPSCVDFTHPSGRGIDEMHMGQIKSWQIFVVKCWSFATVWVVGLQRRRCNRIFYDSVHPSANLLHDTEITVELFLHQLFRTYLLRMLLAVTKIINTTRQIVIVGFHRCATLGNFCKTRPARFCPTRLFCPLFKLFHGRFTLVADIN